MESRGIYMSVDWKAAEPFAKNLIRDLDALREVAQVWKAETIVSQQSNVEELARRIDQFVQFRTELVRLGREDSTAAARTFGDNDANRNVRTALNESLSITVNAVNDPPVRTAGSPAAITVLEDSANSTAVTLGLSGLTYGPGGGTDESPHVYRRLPEVLQAHAGSIRVLHTLRPLGVAMAGEGDFDLYKD